MPVTFCVSDNEIAVYKIGKFSIWLHCFAQFRVFLIAGSPDKKLTVRAEEQRKSSGPKVQNLKSFTSIRTKVPGRTKKESSSQPNSEEIRPEIKWLMSNEQYPRIYSPAAAPGTPPVRERRGFKQTGSYDIRSDRRTCLAISAVSLARTYGLVLLWNPRLLPFPKLWLRTFYKFGTNFCQVALRIRSQSPWVLPRHVEVIWRIKKSAHSTGSYDEKSFREYGEKRKEIWSKSYKSR